MPLAHRPLVLALAASVVCCIFGCDRPFRESIPPAVASKKSSRGNDAEAVDSTFNVKIDQFAFEPAKATIAAGTTVIWTNQDDVPHTVVETSGQFRSEALDTDDAFRHTFKAPGDYSYFCSIHPHMVGEIHVTK